MIRSALEHFSAADVESGRVHALLSMGDLKHRQGDLAEAARWTREAIDLAERQGANISLAVGHQQLGELWAEQGDAERFEASFARALAIFDRAGLPERRAETRERYVRIRTARAEQKRGS
jgi:tetratricopeptide (TPR) repeat protein